MNKNVAIRVQNLTKTYKLYDKPVDRLKESLHPFKKKYHKDFHALDGLSFEIKKGETVGIVGKNGSGKSTLLKIITGVLTPTNGRVTVRGKVSAILELGAGFNPEMTGLENVYLNTSINGMSKNDTDKKIDEIVAFAELGEFIHQPIKTYSSGMKARLAFAVSISVEPDILIVDEALSVGDAAFARKCFAKMEEIRANGATILFVSHSVGSVVSLCNRAIWISNGTQILDGVPKLVTGLYIKHVSEKKIDKKQIEKKYASLANVKVEQKHKTHLHQSSSVSNHEVQKNVLIEEFYDPALKPKSTIYYEEKGAKISDVMITTLDGKKVNVLVQGKEYVYSYKVSPNRTLKNVRFAFMIKRVDGVPLGGGLYPSKDKFLDFVGNTQEVNIRFRCTLNEGEYFFNCGVRAFIDGKNDFVHRIIDAAMVKVLDASNQVVGSVDFIDKIELKDPQ